MFKKFIDISWPVSEKMTAYKNASVVALKQTKNIQEHGVHESLITLGSHSGTHIDAPAHFIEGGALIQNIQLNSLIGSCKVVDLTTIASEQIMPHHLNGVMLEPGDRVLFKTRNSMHGAEQPHDYNFVFINKETASFLVEKRVVAVGIDYLGVERGLADHPAHTIFFENNITILEGLRLQDVMAGSYFLICLPLHIPSLEAAPARAVLGVLNE